MLEVANKTNNVSSKSFSQLQCENQLVDEHNYLDRKNIQEKDERKNVKIISLLILYSNVSH